MIIVNILNVLVLNVIQIREEIRMKDVSDNKSIIFPSSCKLLNRKNGLWYQSTHSKLWHFMDHCGYLCNPHTFGWHGYPPMKQPPIRSRCKNCIKRL